MSKFKIGDKVRAKEGWYCKHPEGSNYNLPRYPGYVKECGEGWMTIWYETYKSPTVNPDGFELVETPMPLYSEEQAVAFLKEKGYTVEAPAEPLKGKIRVILTGTGNIIGYPLDQKIHHTAKELAIIDWTEGQGL